MDFVSMPDADTYYVALGVLSTFTKYTRSSAAGSTARRNLVRNATASCCLGQRAVALRFLVARPASTSRGHETSFVVGDDALSTLEEQRTHGDLILLNMTEHFLRCPQKYLLWLRMAPALFPSAKWIALADDDSYIQVSRLASELRLVSAMTDAESSPVLWGLITWKSFMNNETYDTSTGFTGWSNTDSAAATRRRTAERCAAAAAHYPIAPSASASLSSSSPSSANRRPPLLNTSLAKPACSGLHAKILSAVSRKAIDPLPPWPMANGPLFALSLPLSRALASDDLPMAWLDGIQTTDVARRMRIENDKVPRHLQGFSCFPMGDSVLGLWIAKLGRQGRLGPNMTLVNSPLGVQHFPWASWRFGNRSIVLHGLKSERNVFWAYARQRGLAPWQPIERACDTCAAAGWSTWPGSVVNEWRCCGSVQHGQRVARKASRAAKTKQTQKLRRGAGVS